MVVKCNSSGGLEGIIPKNHFCSMSFFREAPLINWDFTDSVLFTAYDVFRSNDFWLDEVLRSGSTLKEAMVGLGFPKEVQMVVDTGVFEIEAKKSGIARRLGIEPAIELTNEQIFHAYDVSGGDYFVCPDEIVLPDDPPDVVAEKITTIKQNARSLMERIDASQVVGVIQGSKESIIDDIFDFLCSQGVTNFAIGGVIPLYHYDKQLFEHVLKYVRGVTKGYSLHTFGLPRMFLVDYYLHEVGMDSVDTSILIYLTARRRYLVGSNPRPVRLVDFSACDCKGCQLLVEEEPHPRSARFFIGLYMHNLSEAAKLSAQGPGRPEGVRATDPEEVHHISQGECDSEEKQDWPPPTQVQWRTADASLGERKGASDEG